MDFHLPETTVSRSDPLALRGPNFYLYDTRIDVKVALNLPSNYKWAKQAQPVETAGCCLFQENVADPWYPVGGVDGGGEVYQEVTSGLP
jgi:hypothetical protein